MQSEEFKAKKKATDRKYYLSTLQHKVLTPEQKLKIKEQKQWKRIHTQFMALVNQRNREQGRPYVRAK